MTNEDGHHHEADSSASAASGEELRALYEAKASAELDLANARAPGADVVPASGDLLAQVALVKGLPGPAEAAGGPALSGPDGAAADSALAELGYDPSAAFRILSRPEPGLGSAERVARLRYAVEAVDPSVVIALDAQAAEDVWAAFGMGRVAFGRSVRAKGRTLVALDGLEASLGDQVRKKRIWKQMQAIRVGGTD